MKNLEQSDTHRKQKVVAWGRGGGLVFNEAGRFGLCRRKGPWRPSVVVNVLNAAELCI